MKLLRNFLNVHTKISMKNWFLSDLPGHLSFYPALENKTIFLQHFFCFGRSPAGAPDIHNSKNWNVSYPQLPLVDFAGGEYFPNRWLYKVTEISMEFLPKWKVSLSPWNSILQRPFLLVSLRLPRQVIWVFFEERHSDEAKVQKIYI